MESNSVNPDSACFVQAAAGNTEPSRIGSHGAEGV